MNPHNAPYEHSNQMQCQTFASTSNQNFSFPLPQQNPQNPLSYYHYNQKMNPNNYLQPPPNQGNFQANYSNPGPIQKFQQNYPRHRETQSWVQGGNFGGSPFGGYSGPGSTVSSYNGSPALSVISHASRHSTASQLTVVTNISPAAYCGSSLSAPGSENIDPQYEQKTLPNAINQLYSNLSSNTLQVEHVVQLLRVISESASKYVMTDVRRSRISGVVRDRNTRERLFHYILNQSHEILVQTVPNDPFQILRRVWKLFSFLVRCDDCVETLFTLKGMTQTLVGCILQAITVGAHHTPYAVQVLRRLLESRHGAEFRASARIPQMVEVLLNYLPNCHLMETPKYSAIASGNKYEIIDCCRLLLIGEPEPRRTKDAENSAVRQKFLEKGGIDVMLQVIRDDVEEPVLSASTGALKSIVKTKGSEKIADYMVRNGAIQMFAARLDHGSPTLVQNCLICMARICDQKNALLTQPIEQSAILQTINVIGTSDIQIDQYASAFLVNVATIARFKKFVVRSGAVKALLDIINKYAFSFFRGNIDFRNVNSKPYVDVLDNSIRVIAYLSRGIDDVAAVQQMLLELTSINDPLQLLANLAKEKPPPMTSLNRSDRKFKFLSKENHLQLRRHVLLIVQRNMVKFGGRNQFREKLCAFRKAEVFPQTAFEIIYELSSALFRIKSQGDFSQRAINEEFQEIEKLLWNVFPAIIHDFSRASEFAAGIASCFQSDAFVSFFVSIGNHEEQTQIKLVDFCSSFADINVVQNEASIATIKQSFPIQTIQRIIGENLNGRSAGIRCAYDRLVIAMQPRMTTMQPTIEFNDALMESMDFCS